MMELDFTRDALRGLDVEWFAVDRRGAIAILTSGYGAIPKAVFESKERLDRLTSFFGARPESSGARLAEGLATGGDYELFLREAGRGLYAYHHRGYSVLDPYELIASPAVPATLDTVPAEIQALLRPFALGRLEFATAGRLRVQEHVECDV
jgi:hypothetical protein